MTSTLNSVHKIIRVLLLYSIFNSDLFVSHCCYIIGIILRKWTCRLFSLSALLDTNHSILKNKQLLTFWNERTDYFHWSLICGLLISRVCGVPVAEAEPERGRALTPAAPWWLASGTRGWRWRCCRRGGRTWFASGGAAGWPGCLKSSGTPVWWTDKGWNNKGSCQTLWLQEFLLNLKPAENVTVVEAKRPVVNTNMNKRWLRVDCLDAQCF